MDKNRKKTGFFTRRHFKLLLILIVFLFLSITIKNAYAPPPPPAIPTYTWSAHGNTSYGVNRSSIAVFGYSRGNCAHCHEQHASIGGDEPAPNTDGAAGPDKWLLLSNFVSQFDIPCFDCHTEPTLPQYQEPPDNMYEQYNYSRLAGGDTTINCPNTIIEAFAFITSDCAASRLNCESNAGSSHCLLNIVQYLVNKWGFGSSTGDINPCSGCHNPHRAQRDTHASGRLIGEKLPGVVSRPSHHSKDNYAWQLWGDDPGERMSDYTSLYQAPCRYPWSDPCTSFEPDGSSVTDGSNLFDTVTFCLDCHGNSALPVYSTRWSRYLTVIDWGTGGDKHGKKNREKERVRLYPYADSTKYYVLSCLDCHEPHGSRNPYLLRQTVNGINGIQVPEDRETEDLCAACHSNYHGTGSGMCSTSTCHQHGEIF